jgi:hypothetical protein
MNGAGDVNGAGGWFEVAGVEGAGVEGAGVERSGVEGLGVRGPAHPG